VTACFAFVAFPCRRRPDYHDIVGVEWKTLEREPSEADLAFTAILLTMPVARAVALRTRHVVGLRVVERDDRVERRKP
jgi:hypothetical protein